MNKHSDEDTILPNYLDSSLFELFKQVQEQFSFEDSIFTLEHAEMWVRLAIVDDSIAEQVYKQCSEVLDIASNHELGVKQANEYPNELHKQALAMHYIRALGARQLLNLVYQNLEKHSKQNEAFVDDDSLEISKQASEKAISWFAIKNPLFSANLDDSAWHNELSIVEHKRDGVSNFPPLKRLYAGETMAETALNLIHEIALSIDPIREQLLRLVNSYLASRSNLTSHQFIAQDDKLRDWLWAQEGIQDEAMLLIAYQSIKDRPERAETLALRLALISPHLAEKACSNLQALPNDQKLIFATALEKQLKRVGKIRLWVSCRTALNIQKKTENHQR